MRILNYLKYSILAAFICNWKVTRKLSPAAANDKRETT